MSRGITETDVWQAADALLIEGQRPTIERVRQKIGRGSPNTVSPWLDSWFRHLGRRISEPQAFGARPDLPTPVVEAAKQFWQAAQALAAQEFESDREALVCVADQQRSRAGNAEAALAQAAGTIEALTAEHAQVAQELAAAQSTVSRLQQDLHDQQRNAQAAQATMRQLRQELDARTARLEEAATAAVAAVERLARQEAREASAVAALEHRLEAEARRGDDSRQRALAEIDHERAMRGEADRRVKALEGQLAEKSEAVEIQLADFRRRVSRLLRDASDAAEEKASAQAELASARQATAAAVARAEVAAVRKAMKALLVPIGAVGRRHGVGLSGRRVPRMAKPAAGQE